MMVSRELEQHYDVHRENRFLLGWLSSLPLDRLWQWSGKEGVVAAARKMIGATNPLTAEPGTIRGDFGIIGRNIIHGSDAVETARRS